MCLKCVCACVHANVVALCVKPISTASLSKMAFRMQIPALQLLAASSSRHLFNRSVAGCARQCLDKTERQTQSDREIEGDGRAERARKSKRELEREKERESKRERESERERERESARERARERKIARG